MNQMEKTISKVLHVAEFLFWKSQDDSYKEGEHVYGNPIAGID